MTLKIDERPALTVVGMEIVTRPKSAQIPALWPKFVARIGDIQDPREAVVGYGVMWHGESMDVMHYMAAVSVAKPGRVPGGMTLMILPAGKYASFQLPAFGTRGRIRRDIQSPAAVIRIRPGARAVL